MFCVICRENVRQKWYNTDTMKISNSEQELVLALKEEYQSLIAGKESLLAMIDEAEIAESVYNSNAIENSTLTLQDTEKILLEMEFSKNLSLREVYEAKNLARVVEYIRKKATKEALSQELILFLHEILINGINDEIAGRFRQEGEYVRVGNYIASAPEHILDEISSAIEEYKSNFSDYFITKIARFHLEFEHIHPFCDGNGRIGRVLINYQLRELSLPSIIIRDKEKAVYYSAFKEYDKSQKTQIMEKVIYLALLEAFHKRLAYLKSLKIMKLSDYARKYDLSLSSLGNKAKRQTIAAFRQNGIWMIGDK